MKTGSQIRPHYMRFPLSFLSSLLSFLFLNLFPSLFLPFQTLQKPAISVIYTHPFLHGICYIHIFEVSFFLFHIT